MLESVGVRCERVIIKGVVGDFVVIVGAGLPIVIVTTWALVRYLVQLDKGKDPMVSKKHC